MLKLIPLPGLLLAGALAFVAAPPTQVTASECGGHEGQLCEKNEACVNILFYKHCTTKQTYWPGL